MFSNYINVFDFLKRNMVSLYHTFLVLSMGYYLYYTQQENKKLLFEQLEREDFLLKVLKEKDLLLSQKDDFISNKLVPTIIDSNLSTNNDVYFYVGVVCSVFFIGLTIYFLYYSDKPNSGPSDHVLPKKKVSFDLPDENGSIEIIGVEPSNVTVSDMFQKEEENNKIVELIKNLEATVKSQSASVRTDSLNAISASMNQIDNKSRSYLNQVSKGLNKTIDGNLKDIDTHFISNITDLDHYRANQLNEQLIAIKGEFLDQLDKINKTLDNSANVAEAKGLLSQIITELGKNATGDS